MKDLADLGQRVKAAREEKGYTQWQLAEKIGISVPHLSDIERGRKEMGVTILNKLSEALDVSANELLNNSAWKKENTSTQKIEDILDDCTNDETDRLLRLLRYNKLALREEEDEH